MEKPVSSLRTSHAQLINVTARKQCNQRYLRPFPRFLVSSTATATNNRGAYVDTGNVCKYVGYDEFEPESWPSQCAPSKSDWIDVDRWMCGLGGAYPEEFWSCSDIAITAGNLSIALAVSGLHACLLSTLVARRFFLCFSALGCLISSPVNLRLACDGRRRESQSLSVSLQTRARIKGKTTDRRGLIFC